MTMPREAVARSDGRKSISSTQLSDQVASYVRDLIISGQLKQGEFIRLDRLAQDLSMSATPVREALVTLRGEGFLHLEPRRGFVVAPISQRDISDLFVVQAFIAGEMAARAAQNMSDEMLEELRLIHDELEVAWSTGSPEASEELNYRFHRTISKAADSPKLSWLLGVVVRYVPRLFYGAIDGWGQASVDDHRAIIQGLRTKQSEVARQAMRYHILHAGELLVGHLTTLGFWQETAPNTNQQVGADGTVDNQDQNAGGWNGRS